MISESLLAALRSNMACWFVFDAFKGFTEHYTFWYLNLQLLWNPKVSELERNS